MPEQGEVHEITRIQEFFSKLNGIDSFIAVEEEGFPLAFHGLNQDEADAAAALAVDLYTASSEMLRDILGRKQAGREIILVLDENTIIDVVKARNLLLSARGSRKPVEESIEVAASYLEGNRVSCPYCTRDLTLETYKCSKCGKTIPFKSNVCPHCGTMVRIKKCPHCGKLTTGDGRRVRLERPPEARNLAVLEGLVGAVVVGSLTLLATGLAPVAVAAGLAGGASLGYMAYRYSRPEYIVE